MYGVVLFPVWLVFIISGISLLAVSYSTAEVLNDVCDGVNDSESQVVDIFMTYATDID
jgi:hypothetical protein